jgi:hypothetical protein
MPRRPAKVTQADIARAIRAAKEAGAHSVTIDSEGLIRIKLTKNTASNKFKHDLDEAWTPSEALQRLCLAQIKSGHIGDAVRPGSDGR